jgi:hypothetical protein
MAAARDKGPECDRLGAGGGGGLVQNGAGLDRQEDTSSWSRLLTMV